MATRSKAPNETPAKLPPAPAMLSYLKQSSLDEQWPAQYVAKVLSLNAEATNQVIAAMGLQGYIEPAEKPNTFRNTPQGNAVSGAKRPRLKRASADKALDEFLERVRAVNGTTASSTAWRVLLYSAAT